jgi:hypothetical protein
VGWLRLLFAFGAKVLDRVLVTESDSLWFLELMQIVGPIMTDSVSIWPAPVPRFSIQYTLGSAARRSGGVATASVVQQFWPNSVSVLEVDVDAHRVAACGQTSLRHVCRGGPFWVSGPSGPPDGLAKGRNLARNLRK